MSRRRKKKHTNLPSTNVQRVQRDNLTITRSDNRLLDPLKNLNDILTNPYLRRRKDHDRRRSERIHNDRRYYRPETDNRYLTERGNTAVTALAPRTVENTRYRHPLANRIKFVSPERVSVCIRRKQRREVLFKSRSVGKGKTVTPIRRLTEDSKISCR